MDLPEQEFCIRDEFLIDETAMTPTDTSAKSPESIVPSAGQETGYAQGYPDLLAEIKQRIRFARYAALKTVNQELVGLYWDIGRMIVERQAVAGWGKAVVEQLAADLQMEFPGVGGFSASNLWRMKAFFEAYNGLEKLAPLVREIAWSHNPAVMDKCKDSLQREFYIRITRRFGFDFLEPGEAHSERELERSLITRIEDFLRAMGGMFAFMGSQYRLEVDGKAFFIGLLLFHRRLRCLVAIELKIGEFMPEFIGKMQFYLTALDRQVRQEWARSPCRVIRTTATRSSGLCNKSSNSQSNVPSVARLTSVIVVTMLKTPRSSRRDRSVG